MRLTELNPRWIAAKRHSKYLYGLTFDVPVPGAAAEGVRAAVYFEPAINDGPEPDADEVDVGPRWHRTGVSFETLTLDPSIRIDGPFPWHGFVRNGEIVNA
jgi:hypothetical protein